MRLQGGRQAAALQARPAAVATAAAARLQRRRVLACHAAISSSGAAAPQPAAASEVDVEVEVVQLDEASLAGPANAFASRGEAAETRRQLFNRIAPVYDQLNDVLSLGQHRVWKRMAVKWAAAKPGQRALDVCCGSGDLALLLAEAVGRGGSVTGLDFAADMLADAARREAAVSAPWRRAAAVDWVVGDALALPFSDASFHAATVGYGLRNVVDVAGALAELGRVLLPGGRLAVLDFNNSANPAVDALQGALLQGLVVPAASAYGLGDEYAYLRPSIQRYPRGQQLVAMARDAGFSAAAFYELGFGLMGCLVATK